MFGAFVLVHWFMIFVVRVRGCYAIFTGVVVSPLVFEYAVATQVLRVLRYCLICLFVAL